MFNSEASFRNPSEKPRSGEMSIEGLRCSCSFRSTTDYRSPINGLSEINRFELFYKHCIPTGFSDRLLKRAHDLSITRDPGALPLAITFHVFSVKPQRVWRSEIRNSQF